jgi:hypothetical protein
MTGNLSILSASDNSSQAAWGDTTVNSLGPGFAVPLALIFAALVVGLLALAVWKDVRWVRRLRGLVQGVGSLVVYAGYGVGALVPFVVVGGAAWLVMRLPSGTQVGLLKWAGISLAVFLGLAGVGWLAEKWFIRAKKNVEAARAEEVEV